MAVEHTSEDYVKGYEARAKGISLDTNWSTDAQQGWLDAKSDDERPVGIPDTQAQLKDIHSALERADIAIATSLCATYPMLVTPKDRKEWMESAIKHIAALHHSCHGGDDITQALMTEAGL